MRIVHVSDCYLPRLGGIEIQVSELARRQAAAGHQVRVVTTVSGNEAAPRQPDGVTVWRPAGRDHGGIRYLTSLSGRDAALAGDPDLVHVHASTFSPLAFLSARASSRAGVPTVLTVHSLWDYATPLFRAADRLTAWSRWPLTWTAVSEAAAAPLREMTGVEVAVLPNGVDPAQWRVPPTLRAPHHVHLVSVMRLAPRKRPRHLLSMLRAVRARVPADITLTVEIIGEGPERPLLDRYLDRHGMGGWVRLAGRYDHARIRAALAGADLFISPATLESFGIAALEARCAGVPVVARAGTGVGEFVTHGQEGVLVHSDEEMVAAIAGLVTGPAERALMAAHNRTVAPSLSWPRVLARCDAIYRHALHSHVQDPNIQRSRRAASTAPSPVAA